METTKYNVKFKFMNPILGSRPGSPNPAVDFLRERFREENPEIAAENLPLEEANLPGEIARGTSMFYRTKTGKKPCFLSYQVKGCIKYSGEVFNGEWADMKQLRSKIQQMIFISPREIEIINPAIATYPVSEAGEIAMPVLERPLIAQTPQGKRTALAISEMIPEDSEISFELITVKTPKAEITEERLRFLLDYSAMAGMGQWRNSGCYGQFTYELNKL